MKKNNFFIGWSNHMPKKSRKAIGLLLMLIFLLIPILSYVIIIYEKPFNNHRFEIGQVREFHGVYVEKPKPMLILDDTYYPNSFDNHPLLVGYGKFGATSTIREIEKIWGDLAYKQIRIRGTLLYGDGKLVIELTDGVSSISEVSERSHDKDIPSQKTEVLRHGEIIDPKC